MATAAPTTENLPRMRIKQAAQARVVSFATKVLATHKNRATDMTNKMNYIDVAYARYREELNRVGTTDGVDRSIANAPCGNTFTEDDVTPPIVASQVDSYVAYLADVFLSGYPLFPVVSTPANVKYAEQLETLLDDHAQLGGYVRQLLLMLRDGVKYNYSAIEVDWGPVNQFSITEDFSAGSNGRGLSRNNKFFSKIKRLNMRNVVRDMDVPIGDVASEGDYAGYIEVISRTKLKRELAQLNKQNENYNDQAALMSGAASPVANTPNFTEDPVISSYTAGLGTKSKSGVDWDAWFEGPADSQKGRSRGSYGTMFERFVLYARIVPADFGIDAPQPNTIQIWKFVIINGTHLIQAKRIVTAYDYLPVLFGQPLEDGLGDQTQSIAEGEIPFQKAAATLFNIRFAGARRAVSDRGLFRNDMITSANVNAKGAAAKIPVSIPTLSNLKLSDAYYPIPFSNQGLENVMNDAQMIVGFSKELHGINGPRQGSFQKGNKSVQEWNDTMDNSGGRMRLPALSYEYQVFAPLKSILTLNLYQYAADQTVTQQQTGKNIEVKIDELRRQVLAFKLADGMTPKSKLAGTEAIGQGMQLLQTSPILQSTYGQMLPSMFAHFMSLLGVKNLDQYDPRNVEATAAAAIPGEGVPAANVLQPGVDPNAPAPNQLPPVVTNPNAGPDAAAGTPP